MRQEPGYDEQHLAAGRVAASSRLFHPSCKRVFGGQFLLFVTRPHCLAQHTSPSESGFGFLSCSPRKPTVGGAWGVARKPWANVSGHGIGCGDRRLGVLHPKQGEFGDPLRK